jgi:methanogenic corrinoid protein MtbC1
VSPDRKAERLDKLDSLSVALIELDEDLTLELTREILEDGQIPPLHILQSCQHAMRVVGERYERREYYLSGLILAGEVFKEVLDLVQPEQRETTAGSHAGTVLLGTVAGDIHDIGKNMFGTALRSLGFAVVDLGVDVAPDRFLQEAKLSRPDVICLSGLITTAYHSMKATVQLLRANNGELGYAPPIVLGGATIDEEVCHYAGADSWSTDAMEGVRICQRILTTR